VEVLFDTKRPGAENFQHIPYIQGRLNMCRRGLRHYIRAASNLEFFSRTIPFGDKKIGNVTAARNDFNHLGRAAGRHKRNVFYAIFGKKAPPAL
ncbi:MAG: hypothetical protein WA004_20410, partial [Saprospiraceae bacterium]